MGRTKEQQREYMRVYRLRKKLAPTFAAYSPQDGANMVDANARIEQLEAQLREAHEIATGYVTLSNDLTNEVRHLKEELARRPDSAIARVGGRVVDSVSFNSRPFTPVPKKGHG